MRCVKWWARVWPVYGSLLVKVRWLRSLGAIKWGCALNLCISNFWRSHMNSYLSKHRLLFSNWIAYQLNTCWAVVCLHWCWGENRNFNARSTRCLFHWRHLLSKGSVLVNSLYCHWVLWFFRLITCQLLNSINDFYLAGSELGYI